MSLLRMQSTSVALVSVAMLALVGCGSDKPKTSSTTLASADSTTASTDDAPAPTNAPPVLASTNADGSVTVVVTVGIDDFDTTGGKRVVSVKKGTTVTISLTDPGADEQYHFHGYDLEFEATKGNAGKVTFTADETGQFDLESHLTEKTLLVLVVS